MQDEIFSLSFFFLSTRDGLHHNSTQINNVRTRNNTLINNSVLLLFCKSDHFFPPPPPFTQWPVNAAIGISYILIICCCHLSKNAQICFVLICVELLYCAALSLLFSNFSKDGWRRKISFYVFKKFDKLF